MGKGSSRRSADRRYVSREEEDLRYRLALGQIDQRAFNIELKRIRRKEKR